MVPNLLNCLPGRVAVAPATRSDITDTKSAQYKYPGVLGFSFDLKLAEPHRF